MMIPKEIELELALLGYSYSYTMIATEYWPSKKCVYTVSMHWFKPIDKTTNFTYIAEWNGEFYAATNIEPPHLPTLKRWGMHAIA